MASARAITGTSDQHSTARHAATNGGARPAPERAALERATLTPGTAEWADHCVALAERKHLWHTARREGDDEYGRAVYLVPRGVVDATALRPWGEHRVLRTREGRYHCDCPAFGGHGYCSHVGAVILVERQVAAAGTGGDR